jgi:hypothetical protein
MSVNLCMIKTTHLMSKLLKNLRVTCQNINVLYIYGLVLTLDLYITPRHESEKDKNGYTDKINTHDSLLIYS